MRTKARSVRLLLSVMLSCALILTISGCVVVRHSDLEADDSGVDQMTYSAESYREENWDKLVDNIVSRSADANAVLDAINDDVEAAGEKFGRKAQQTGSAWNFGIEGTAKVIEINTELQAGNVLLDLEPYDGQADLLMQVGPVFRTNTLRDFADFIRFDDFSNQVEYANLTGAFNRAVFETLLDGIEWQEGSEYDFVGAFTWQDSTDPDKIQMIPVQLTEAGG